jgi:phage terminase small subunit
VSLSDKQRAFVMEYIKDFNATRAAIRAGYSEKTANQQGPRLLVNVGIKAEIERLIAERVMGPDLAAASGLQFYFKGNTASLEATPGGTGTADGTTQLTGVGTGPAIIYG